MENLIKAFKESMNAEKEELFKKKLGYGMKEIEDIGFDKFFKAMGWEEDHHVSSWETDAISIVVCPACNNDFGPFQISMGLCDGCEKDFYTREVENLNDADGIIKASIAMQTESLDVVQMFYMSNKVRESFRRHKGLVDDLENSTVLSKSFMIGTLMTLCMDFKVTDSLDKLRDTILSTRLKNNKTLGENTAISDYLESKIDEVRNGDKIVIAGKKATNAWVLMMAITQDVMNEVRKFTHDDIAESIGKECENPAEGMEKVGG